MADEKDLDIDGAIEKSAERLTVDDLQKRGFQKVKVLNESNIRTLISEVVDRVANTRSAEEREKILAQSRKELDRILQEQKRIKSRAQLLETDKNELIEQVESLQRELELRMDIDEEEQHKQLQKATASLQEQVEEVKERQAGAEKELESARQKLEEEQSRTRGAEKARSELVQQVLQLQGRAQEAEQEAKNLKADQVRQRSEAMRLEQESKAAHAEAAELKEQRAREQKSAHEETVRLRSEVEREKGEAARIRHASERHRSERADRERELNELRKELKDAREERDRERDGAELAARERSDLRDQVTALERRTKSDEAELAQLRGEGERSESDLAKLRNEVERDRSELQRLREELEAERKKRENVESSASNFQERLEEVQGQARSEQRELQELKSEAFRQGTENENLRKDLEEARKQAEAGESAKKELRSLREEADRLQIENVEIRQEGDRARSDLSRTKGEAEAEREERAKIQEALEESRNEVSLIRGQLAEQQKLSEDHKGKTVVVMAELEEIEDRQKTEHEELQSLRNICDRLKAEAQGLNAQLALHEETARHAREEAADERTRAKEWEARARTANETALEDRLGRLEQAVEGASRNSAAAKQAAVRAQAATAGLPEILARPKKRGAGKEPALRDGVVFDGAALLEDFFRKIKLKELLQKHVPVKEKPGQPHPTERMIEVIESVVAGEQGGKKADQPARLDLFGPSRGADPAILRKFLAGFSPQAVRAVGRVHRALRLHLVRLPKKPDRLVLDVDAPEIGVSAKTRARGSYRPLVCYEPGGSEFYRGQLRPSRAKDDDGLLPFLEECVAQVPSTFARGRIRFRMDARFFGEPVIRFLERKGCGYVIAAPDDPAVRAGAKKASFRPISGGWEVGEFSLRLHPIRKTQARFLVLRKKLSKKSEDDKPATFRDPKYAYHVFAADEEMAPWRAWQFYTARPRAEAGVKDLLRDFSGNGLLGRGRRAHAAFFQFFILASDLLQWFQRFGLPEAEQERSRDSLRRDVLMLPATGQGRGSSLVVLSKKDPRRRLYGKASNRIQKVRPVAPFKLRR